MAKKRTAQRGSKATKSPETPAQPTVTGLQVGAVAEEILSDHGNESPAELSAAAARAEAEYDYERAVNLLRLAVLESAGAPDSVETLARFLVETYGQYEEAVALLRSRAAKTGSRPALTRLLADALYLLERHDEAYPHYQALVRFRTPPEDSEPWTRLGLLSAEAGDEAAALEALGEALRRNPADRVAEQHRLRVAESLASRGGERIAHAREAFGKGDTAGARTILGEVLAGPVPNREATHLMREIEAHEAQERRDTLVTAAQRAEREDALEQALEHWRAAGHEAPNDEEVRAAIERLEQRLAAEIFHDSLERGAQAVRDGRFEDAIHAFYRAHGIRPAGVEVRADLEGRHLYDLTADFLSEVGARHLERAAPVLAVLCRAEMAIAADKPEEAAPLLRQAAPALGGFRRLESAQKVIASHIRKQALEKAQAAYDEGRAHEAAEETEAAIQSYERSLTIAAEGNAGGVRDAETRIATLRERLQRRDEYVRLRARLLALAEGERWFALCRTLAEAAPALASDPELVTLREEAKRAIDARYPVKLTSLSPPPPNEWGLGLDSRANGLPDIDRAHARVLHSPDGSHLLVLSGPLLVQVCTHKLTACLVAEMSEDVSFGMKGELVLLGYHPREGSRLALVSEAERNLTLIQVTEDEVQVEDVFDLDALLTGRNLLRYYGLHGPSERLVQLATPRKSNGPSKLKNLSLKDGRIVHEESYGYGLWNLLPYPNTDLFAVNRVPEPALCRMPGYFTFAMMDYRGRLVRRINLPPEELPEPMERIRSITRCESLDRLFLTYDYYDAMGNIVRNHPALLVLQSGDRIFYQSAAPEKLLSGKRLPKGPLRILEPRDGEPLLILPYSNAEGVPGISVLDAAELKPRFELEFDEGETLHSLHTNGADLLALTHPYGDGAWRLRKLDLNTRSWLC